jgi:hypothetical protein
MRLSVGQSGKGLRPKASTGATGPSVLQPFDL